MVDASAYAGITFTIWGTLGGTGNMITMGMSTLKNAVKASWLQSVGDTMTTGTEPGLLHARVGQRPLLPPGLRGRHVHVQRDGDAGRSADRQRHVGQLHGRHARGRRDAVGDPVRLLERDLGDGRDAVSGRHPHRQPRVHPQVSRAFDDARDDVRSAFAGRLRRPGRARRQHGELPVPALPRRPWRRAAEQRRQRDGRPARPRRRLPSRRAAS